MSSSSITYSNVHSMFNWTIVDISAIETENKIDNAIDWIRLIAGITISNMSGTAGSKTVTVTAFQRPIILVLAGLYCAAYITGGSGVGLDIQIGDLKQEKVKDISVNLMIGQVQQGIEALKRSDEIALDFYNMPIDSS